MVSRTCTLARYGLSMALGVPCDKNRAGLSPISANLSACGEEVEAIWRKDAKEAHGS
jgi:hypothetical protein